MNQSIFPESLSVDALYSMIRAVIMSQDSSSSVPLFGFTVAQTAVSQATLATLSMGASASRHGIELARQAGDRGFDLLDETTDAEVDEAREAVDEALHTASGLSFAAERGLSATVDATTEATEELSKVCSSSVGSTVGPYFVETDTYSGRLLTDGGADADE